METKKEFELYIKSLCALNGISMSELARRFGTSPQNFNARLKTNGFDYPELVKIADILGYTIEWVKK